MIVTNSQLIEQQFRIIPILFNAIIILQLLGQGPVSWKLSVCCVISFVSVLDLGEPSLINKAAIFNFSVFEVEYCARQPPRTDNTEIWHWLSVILIITLRLKQSEVCGKEYYVDAHAFVLLLAVDYQSTVIREQILLFSSN